MNPGLESGTTTLLNWTFVNQGANTPIWDSVSHSGSRSIKISIPGTTNVISGYPQSELIEAQPLTTYIASVWGKTLNTGGSNTPAARVVELDANKNWIRQNNILPVFGRGTNDWTQRTVEFQTAANTRYLYVYANIWNGYGNFWMDDVMVSLKTPTPALTPTPIPTPIVTPTPAPVETNLVLNPGLESGTTIPLNWTFVNQGANTPIWDSVSHSGSRSIKISIPGTTNAISGYPQSDIITAQPLTSYTASVWGKTQNTGGSNTPVARVVELDANKNWIRQNNILPVFGRGTNDWAQRTVEFQTAANTKYLYVYANIWNGYGNFWMDDVVVRLKDAQIPTATPLVTPTPTVTVTPIVTPTPLPTTLPSSCSYIISTDGNKVYAQKVSNGKIEFSGTLNEVLSFTAKSGNHICLKNGDYSLNTITLQPDVIIECESNNAIIKAADVFYLVYLKSDSTIKGCTFDHKGKTKTIYVSGEVKNWKVENNYFINSNIAVLVENLNTGVKKNVDISNNLPTSGWGSVVNNKGLHSKLITMEGTRNITVTGNYFTNLDGSEYADFNYNVHHVFFDNNTFINNNGFSLTEEVIDMIGGNGYLNSYNTVSNNRIIGNFNSGIRPAKSSSYNIIENNQIEYKPGTVSNLAGIYFYGSGTSFSTPRNNKVINNTIIGTSIGIELSGSDNNIVSGNKISNTIKGISLVKTSSSTYGSSVAPQNNKISQNVIDNINYGIYISSSPNNVITNNYITNYKLSNIFGG